VAEKTHGAVRLGAALAAPTAPHATLRLEGTARASGPERFWRGAWGRAAYLTALALSFAVHYAIAPWSLLPRHELEYHDVDGTLTIPVDLLSEAPPLPPPPPPPIEPPAPPPTPEGLLSRHADAAPPPMADAGLADSPVSDAPVDGPDGGDASPLDDAAVASADDAGEAGPPGSARDAVGMIGAAGNVQAGPQNVVLTVNMGALRTHPEGKRLGPLIAAVPQWDTFIVGTGIDPLRDIDWISINGPALRHTEKDVILVHYSASDAAVDKAIGVLAKKSGKGGPMNVGVPGVKAVRGYADQAERVFLRPQSHVLAVVPAYYAKTAAQILTKATVPPALKRPAEAIRLTLVHPHGPMPAIPEDVTEIRLWIVPRDADGGADVFAEGDTASSSACEAAVGTIGRVIQDQNSFGVQLVTHGLLNHVELRADGSTLRAHLSVSRDQIQVILAFVGGQLGVPMTPEPVPSGSTPPP
jgi:hypothetical protein